ncbi:hypothetical protein [Pseudomonas arcuscaelestis]|uniref:hypothetical protein n=1 Tax=Pseudomonas arcuscaelestis TaxID=2710591 RepID=UPI001F41DF85|nr:hypothetical protein [Pseudomonas arcuscaelestis]
MKKKAIRPKPRIKAGTFSPKCRLGRWGGYRAWAEYMAKFTRYVQVAMDGHHDDWSTQQGGDLNPEVQAYALGDADLYNLVDPQRLVVGPARPEAPRHLYALDADDLLEFTAEDVLAAWTLRTQCCGTKEVAAELYALFRVLNGDDDSYAGPAAYLDDQTVLAMFPVPESQEQAVRAELSSSGAAIGSVDAPEPEVEVAQEMASGLTLADVRGLTIEPLKAAWGNRPESFASLEAAAETLAILRSLNSKATEKPSYRVMMEHDLVQDLVDSLPLEIAHNAPAPAVELELLRRDQRVGGPRQRSYALGKATSGHRCSNGTAARAASPAARSIRCSRQLTSSPIVAIRPMM